MDYNDKQAIEGLFGKLAEVEHQTTARDAEAEHYIADRINRQPGAPYFMAQTVIVQEHALNAAQSRIEELEYQLQSSQQGAAQGGGFLSRMFGGGAAAPAARMPARQSQGYGRAPGQGGGFLAGAAQTAMGVAGGVLLGNAVMGMFGGEAEAAPAPEEEPEEDTGAFEDAGGWDEEI